MNRAKNVSQALQYNKANFQMLEQERNMLKITLQHMTAQNEKLKNELEDMRMTAKQNKELLKEYVEKITNKDKVFEKMNAQIEQLTNRLKILENYKKLKPSVSNEKTEKKKKIKEQFNMTSTSNNIISTNSNNNKTNPNQNSTLSTSNKTISNPNPIVKEDSKHNVISSNSINNGHNTNISVNCNSNSNNNKEKMKEFINRQSALIEEMSSLKDDIQFILENKSKSKLRDKLNQSISSNSNQSMNNSVIHSHSSHASNRNVNMNESSLLNSSIISNISTQTVKKKINIKDRFHISGNLTDFLSNYSQLKNLLFLIDNHGIVWELIKRTDINPHMVTSNPFAIKSILCCCDRSLDDKLHHIEIKDPFDNQSLAASEEDFGKYSDFNISKYIKEID